MKEEVLSALVLAGGRAVRMGGADKAALTLAGVPFRRLHAAALRAFPEKLYAGAAQGAPAGFEAVPDPLPGLGPLGGLYGGLQRCRGFALLTVPCDLPFFDAALAGYLAGFADRGWPAWACRDASGGEHPLCGVYRKECLPLLEEHLRQGRLRARDFFRAVGGHWLDLTDTPFDPGYFFNVNTPQSWQSLWRPAALAVCGAHHSGKTTLIEGMLPLLRAEGLRTAVLKHTHHGQVRADAQNADTARLVRAGAQTVVLYGPQTFALWREGRREDAALLSAVLRECSLILLEGGKHSDWPKLEVTDAAGAVLSEGALLTVPGGYAPEQAVAWLLDNWPRIWRLCPPHAWAAAESAQKKYRFQSSEK